MKTLTVEVKDDHVSSLCRAKRPIYAIAELIWNSLDADSNSITILTEDNVLGSLTRIQVKDDGHAIAYEDALADFGSLGGSWKRTRNKSKIKGRLLHGRSGKGRFRAFAIGQKVTWKSVYSAEGVNKEFSIVGNASDPCHFQVTDPTETNSATGVEVIIENLFKDFHSLKDEQAGYELAVIFAIYLRQYPNIELAFNKTFIKIDQLESAINDYPIKTARNNAENEVDSILTIIEWVHPTDRALYLCDQDGFAHLEIPTGVHAKGFNFTAYLKSDIIGQLQNQGQLELEELNPSLKEIIDSAKTTMRSHFRKKSSEAASELVSSWKKQSIYPFEDEPKNPIQEAERQVFDICALNIHSYLPDFATGSDEAKILSFKLLRNVVETSPNALRRILGEVLGLPSEKQLEFAELLNKTSLDAIISASTIVTERITFLQALGLLVFDTESKKQLLERKQLHRILANHTWVFGEEFNLTLDDQSLTELLKKHRKEVGDDIEILDDVVREDGSKGILDLVLGRRIPTPRGEDREHLIVELKRPKFELNDDSLAQIRSYAFAVAADERFRSVHTKWSFWLISNCMNKSVQRQATQRNMPPGCIHDDSDQNIQIWVKDWGQVIADCEGRLRFYEEQLQFRANRDDALQYLRREYKKYLPPICDRPLKFPRKWPIKFPTFKGVKCGLRNGGLQSNERVGNDFRNQAVITRRKHCIQSIEAVKD